MGSMGTRFGKRANAVVRTRICIKCKHKIMTAEVDYEDHLRQEALIKSLETAISVYLQRNEPSSKIVEDT